MLTVEQKVLEAIEHYNLMQKGDKIIVALSGGADSVTLLSVLNGLKETLGIMLYAVHVNHNLRGKDSSDDQGYAEELCGKMNIPLRVFSVDVKGNAQKHKSVEETARELRYEAFAEAAQQLGAKVATAHNSCDNTETVLLNMLRGTGLKGLCGIPAKRDYLIRPLIFCTRAEIEQYCENEGLKFVTDKTNFSEDYTRNKLRLKILPKLLEINPSLYDGIGRMTKILTEDSNFLENEAKNSLISAKIDEGIYDAKKLALLPEPILHRTISLILREKNIEPTSVRISAFAEIIRLGNGKVNVEKNKFAVVKKGKATLSFIEQNYRK